MKHQVHILFNVVDECRFVFELILFRAGIDRVLLVYLHGIVTSLDLRLDKLLYNLSLEISEQLCDHLNAEEAFLVVFERLNDPLEYGDFVGVVPCLDDISDSNTCFVD